MITDKARNILLKKERREKIINVAVKVKLITIIKHSNKRILIAKAIITTILTIQYSKYEKPHNDKIY